MLMESWREYREEKFRVEEETGGEGGEEMEEEGS